MTLQRQINEQKRRIEILESSINHIPTIEANIKWIMRILLPIFFLAITSSLKIWFPEL